MNKKLKESLRTAFDAPMPKLKSEFVSSVNFPKATRFDFICAQAGYIRKRVWVVTILTIVPSLIALFSNITDDILGLAWIASSLLPFVVLAGMTEIARSVSYNMAELEISCKYGFSDVVLARLGILGCTNMIVFTVVIVSFRIAGNIEVLRLGAYLLIPFLLTCSLSLFALNRLRPKESVYICGAISCFVSIANAVFSNEYRIAFSGEYMAFWAAAFFILLIWTTSEIIKLIRRTEENQWNLSLTA